MSEKYVRVDEVATKGSKLLSSLDDYLAALPAEDAVFDEVFREPFVDLETWLYSPEYMNLEVRLSAIQLELLQALDNYDPSTNVKNEFVAEWGKGGGKDFISGLAALRCVYWLHCLRKPYGYYGLAKDTGIQLANVAYTAEQAQFIYLKQVKNLLNQSPWFIRNKFQITRTRVKFRNEIELVAASTDGDSAEGQNLIFAVMDEASAFKDSKIVKETKRADGVKIDRAADAIYKVLRTSTESRFPTVGKVVIISYPRYKGDYIEEKLAENRNKVRGFISGPYATWEVNSSKKRSDFDAAYEENPEQADAMYNCKPPFSEDGWVKYPGRFLECVKESAKLNIKSPINAEGIYDPYFQGTPGKNYVIHVDLALKKDRCVICLATQGNPIVRSKCPCNQWNMKDVTVCVNCGTEEDRWIKRELPTMLVVALQEIKPKELSSGRKEVDFSEVREQILFFRNRGHKIWALTYDGWQSRDSVQQMQKIFGKREIKDRWGRVIGEQDIVTTLSVDRDTKSYDTLKELIYDGRLFIAPPHDVKEKEDWEISQDPTAMAYREFRALRLINNKKVDHAIGGGKDFTDTLAGCAYHVAQMPIAKFRMPSISGWSETPRGGRR